MLSRVQELLLSSLRDPDPLLCLQETVGLAHDLSDDERKWLLAIDGDGLRLTRMLVRKLRLQRVVRGDPGAAEFMARDPEGFARCFARYEQEVAPTHVFPKDEATAFRSYW